jgi:hypothetical protein
VFPYDVLFWTIVPYSLPAAAFLFFSAESPIFQVRLPGFSKVMPFPQNEDFVLKAELQEAPAPKKFFCPPLDKRIVNVHNIFIESIN